MSDKKSPIIDRIVFDSRKIVDPKNTAFFALNGTFRDGHQFIDSAFDQGIRIFVVSQKIDAKFYPDAFFILVEDTLKSLQKLAYAHRKKFNYPIIADPAFEVSKLYDMVHPNASDKFTVRSVFIIGADKKVKLILTYPASTGRNFIEILRVIDSLQLTANYSVATPANWKDGEDVVIAPAIKDEEIAAKFPKGYTKIKPYLRLTPQPNK
jgi:hypothetical protein